MPLPVPQYDPNAYTNAFQQARSNRLQDVYMQRDAEATQYNRERQKAADQRVADRDAQDLQDHEREILVKVYAPLAQQAVQSGDVRGFYASALANPQVRAQFQRDGFDMDEADLEDPDFEAQIAGLAQMGPTASQKVPAIGAAQPGDYEADSLAEFAKTGDYSKLRRYTAPQAASSGPAPPSGYQFTADRSRLVPIPGGPADPGVKTTKDDTRVFAKADKLRDEFNAQSKEFVTVGDSYNLVQQVAANPSAAGDLSMIFAYMKMLDPNSVVREQEFANAQNAAGVPDRVRNAYNKALKGERLNPEQRQDFIAQAGNLYKTRKARQDVLTKRYTEIAKRNGVNADDVVGDLSVSMQATAPNGPMRVSTPEEAMRLPPGTQFITPDGRLKVRP